MLTLWATKATPHMVAVKRSRSEFLTGIEFSFFIIAVLLIVSLKSVSMYYIA